MTSQIETGTPYLVYKDPSNSKSNQQNLGIIKSSNLCTEIIEYTDENETAVCNLASISLKSCLEYKNYSAYEVKIYSKPNCIFCVAAENYCNKYNIKYVKLSYKDITFNSEVYPIGVSFPKIFYNKGNGFTFIGGFYELESFFRPTYNYNMLKNISKKLVYNLNNIIDYNYYPTEKAERSNFKHRPVGLGVQGLANVFYEMKISFDSDEAKIINKNIFETIYYGSLEASMEIARDRIDIIETYKKMESDLTSDKCILASHLLQNNKNLIDYKSKYNILEYELNRTEYVGTYSTYIGSPMYNGKLQFDLWNKEVDNSLHDWTSLREEIKCYGVRNSLLVAPMPTASTAQILGNYECFEPIMSNIYSRRVLAGEYMVMNDYLIEDLISLGLWNRELKDKIIVNDGSIQAIEGIPQIIKNRYKTVWEIKQKNIIDMAIQRGKYICQSQSMNLFLESPNTSTLTSMHFYAWSKGLKTGIYYLRSRPSSKAIQFTVEPECENCSA